MFRLVTQPPQRLSMDTRGGVRHPRLSTQHLIEVQVVNTELRRTAGDTKNPAPGVRRTTIRRPEGL